ncbi:hypothetical protein [Streptomyces sp. NPDC005760]|uniref:hypothetical protein n=1 Tax=Streptomyces sp. NPDC005760 TaxID=3156718 RepID=UPI003400248E
MAQEPQHQELDPAALATVVRKPAMVDARNTLDAQAWHPAGRRLCAPGRPRPG